MWQSQISKLQRYLTRASISLTPHIYTGPKDKYNVSRSSKHHFEAEKLKYPMCLPNPLFCFYRPWIKVGSFSRWEKPGS